MIAAIALLALTPTQTAWRDVVSDFGSAYGYARICHNPSAVTIRRYVEEVVLPQSPPELTGWLDQIFDIELSRMGIRGGRDAEPRTPCEPSYEGVWSRIFDDAKVRFTELRHGS